jgi:hypothetical protein
VKGLFDMRIEQVRICLGIVVLSTMAQCLHKNEIPFLDCFTHVEKSEQKVVVDCGGSADFFTYTKIDSTHLLVIHASKNQIPLSNRCQTYTLSEKNINSPLMVYVSELSEGRQFYVPCSDTYGYPPTDNYYVSKGTITLALAKFEFRGKNYVRPDQFRLMARITDAEFINKKNNKKIELDDFSLTYSDERDWKVSLAPVSPEYRVEFPVIKPLNSADFTTRAKEKMASNEIPEDAEAYVSFTVDRNGTIARIKTEEIVHNKVLSDFLLQEVPNLKYQKRESYSMPEIYHSYVSIRKYAKEYHVYIH